MRTIEGYVVMAFLWAMWTRAIFVLPPVFVLGAIVGALLA